MTFNNKPKKNLQKSPQIIFKRHTEIKYNQDINKNKIYNS